jgi:copper chaperone CopZ
MLCSVSGLQNKEEKTQIKNALNKLEGVNEVGVNLQTGTIEIKYNEPATPNDIKNCIKNTRFKIVYE